MMGFFVPSLALVVFVFSSQTWSIWAKCSPGTDATNFAQRLVEASRPTEPGPLRIPRRLMGDVYLKRGFISGLQSFQLAEEPVTVTCFNDTVGAIQPKMYAEDVSVVYDWVFGEEESWGRALLPPQRLYIDLDIDQVQQEESRSFPHLLGFYVTQPTKSEFKIQVLGGRDHSNAEQIVHHVKIMTQMAFSRDGRLAITFDLGPRVEGYLASNTFKLE